jgi:hypothetical protein
MQTFLGARGCRYVSSLRRNTVSYVRASASHVRTHAHTWHLFVEVVGGEQQRRVKRLDGGEQRARNQSCLADRLLRTSEPIVLTTTYLPDVLCDMWCDGRQHERLRAQCSYNTITHANTHRTAHATRTEQHTATRAAAVEHVSLAH